MWICKALLIPSDQSPQHSNNMCWWYIFFVIHGCPNFKGKREAAYVSGLNSVLLSFIQSLAGFSSGSEVHLGKKGLLEMDYRKTGHWMWGRERERTLNNSISASSICS